MATSGPGNYYHLAQTFNFFFARIESCIIAPWSIISIKYDTAVFPLAKEKANF